MRSHHRLLPVLAALAVAGCGSGSETTTPTTTGETTTTTTTTVEEKLIIVSLVADANRDGVADPKDPGDAEDKTSFSNTHGASFLANVDDDDGDQIRDCDDDKINGDADIADLAKMAVEAWPDAPDGAVGKLTVDQGSLDTVRVWKKGLDGVWSLVAGSVGPCTKADDCQLVGEATLSTDEIRAGVEIGVEGRRFVMAKDDPWSGEVTFTYRVAVSDDPAAGVFVNEARPDGIDTVKMRVAPWVLFGNLSPFDTVWAVDDSNEFISGIKVATNAAGLQMHLISNYNDQWAQDYFQTAWTAIPGPNGTVQGMRVANPRPWGQSSAASQLPVAWLQKTYLGPDRGMFVIYKKANSGSTFDSHGNHDLLPPYESNGKKWPLGRVLAGSGVLPETISFYAAQIQGPAFRVETDWLWVGHVDEFLSYVPAQNARGWKLLVASSRLMRQMLQDQQAAGNGGLHMFVNKKRYLGSGNQMVSAEVSIDEVLADTDLMKASQDAQADIDTNLALLKAEIGLPDEDIIEIPTLFEDIQGYKIAYSPGTVNLLAFGDYVVHADPFGPKIGGVDMFKKDLNDRLGTGVNKLGKAGNGLQVYFTDDWYLYHILDGEVHCGTNPEAPAPFSDVKWWEVVQ
jgi:protein-arginine deiminase